jgi:SAM-dependent methyltransferase
MSHDAQDNAMNMLPVVEEFIEAKLIRQPKGLTVWDLGCGTGPFVDAFVRLGAARVFATDIVINRNAIPPNLLTDARVVFVDGGFDAATRQIGEAGIVPADIVFMHLMTEHVSDARGFFYDLSRIVRPSTEIFVHHDNFYQPTGHHDHGFLFLNEKTWAIEPQGVQCWEMPEKCAASESHRASVGQRWPFLWSAASGATLNPARCKDCNYFRRSTPWAHLVYANDWRRTFPERWFCEQVNRITPKQLRWFIEEAGFVVNEERRTWIANAPPAGLLDQYAREDLTTFTYSLRARKCADH